MVFGLYAGFIFAGGGELENECSGSACTYTRVADDYDEESEFALGADLLGHVSPQFRLGGGLLFLPSVKVKVDGASRDAKFGSELSAVIIGEGVFDVAPTTALTLRGMGGPLFLFPGKDLEDAIDGVKARCPSCDVSDGPFVGYTFGVGGGGLFSVGNVGLRAGLLFQYYGVRTLRVEGDTGTGTGTAEETLSSAGTRFMLTAGVEF